MGVYFRVPCAKQLRCKDKSLKTHWTDENKADSVKTNYGSRLVWKEFRTYTGDTLYAPAPLLEALRLIICRAAADDNNPGN